MPASPAAAGHSAPFSASLKPEPPTPAAGGPRSKIVDIPGSRPDVVFGASWGDGDVIVFATISGLWRVQASGAELEQIRERKDDEGVALRLPHVLPGGQAILYTVRRRIAWSSTSFSALDRLEWLVGPRTWGNPDVIDRQSGLTMSLAPGTRLGAYEITG